MGGVFWEGEAGGFGGEKRGREVGVSGFVTGRISLFGTDYNKSVIFMVRGRMWRGWIGLLV